MAKELPYFQFEPAEYLTKDISFCSLEAQGLFINICSYYWQRNCELTREQVLRRLNYPDALNELISEGIIDLKEDKITIKFLDNQRNNAITKSEINAKNGAKGGRPKKPKETEIKANKNPIESELKGIRKDKIIEDEIKEDNTNANKLAEGVVEYFNGVCVNLPKVVKLTDKRKKHILARLKEHSKEDIKKVIDLTAESNFLNGKNTNGWTASFDWIMDKSNFIKILENNYINKQNGKDRRQISVEDFNESIERHFR